MKYLSGATGYTILEKENKTVILLADIHDGVSYCQRDSSKNIDKSQNIDIDVFLKDKTSTHQVVLEESLNEMENLTDLWPNAEHTRKLKELKEKNNEILPTDIRPYLIPFSWQLAESNDNYKKLQINKYLYYFKNFFNKKGKVYERYIFPYYEYIDHKNRLKLINIFNIIEDLFLKIYQKYDGLTIEQIFVKDKEYMHSIDNINSLIMEYYILLLILSDKRDSVIHTGLAHSTRIKSILKEEFEYEIREDHGMTHIDQYTGSNKTNACILNPKLSEFFSKKKKSIFI